MRQVDTPLYSIFSAGGGEDYAVAGDFLGELGEVVAAWLCAVASADEEEVANFAGLYGFDNFVGEAEHGGIMESRAEGSLGILREGRRRQGLFNDPAEIPAFDVRDAGATGYSAGE